MSQMSIWTDCLLSRIALDARFRLQLVIQRIPWILVGLYARTDSTIASAGVGSCRTGPRVDGWRSPSHLLPNRIEHEWEWEDGGRGVTTWSNAFLYLHLTNRSNYISSNISFHQPYADDTQNGLCLNPTKSDAIYCFALNNVSLRVRSRRRPSTSSSPEKLVFGFSLHHQYRRNLLNILVQAVSAR